jgi:hypothetical protein
MRHEHLAGALVELKEMVKTSPRAMNATPIHDHHDLFAGFAKDAHNLM